MEDVLTIMNPPLLHTNDTIMTINSEFSAPPKNPANTSSNLLAGNLLTCIASDDMTITGSGEYNVENKGGSRLSWQVRDNTNARDDLGHRRWKETTTPGGEETETLGKDSSTSIEEADVANKSTFNIHSTSNHQQTGELSKSMRNLKTSNHLHPPNGDADRRKSSSLRTFYAPTDTEHETRGRADSTKKRSGSRSSKRLAQIRKSQDPEIELSEIGSEAKDGVGGTSLVSQAANNISAVLLYSNSPPASPPQQPLAHHSPGKHTAENGQELDEIPAESSAYASMHNLEAYEQDMAETAHIVVEVAEGGLSVREEEAVGAAIMEPKTDSMVTKEIVRISVVAVIALLVVLLFVLT